MRKIKVKISTVENNSFFHQTPKRLGEWGRCKFYANKEIKKCDYWVVLYDGLSHTETVLCPKDNTIYVTEEPISVNNYQKSFISQFASIMTSQTAIKHKNAIHQQQILPWRIGRIEKKDPIFNIDYDQLVDIKNLQKPKLISLTTSTKFFTYGHRERVYFVDKLYRKFGNKIDFFGKGIKEVKDKWEVLAPYKYHIVIENSAHKDYWTEKLTDAYLSLCYPIYYGCLNIHQYFNKKMLTTIDIHQPDKAIKSIENIMQSRIYENSFKMISQAKNLCLNQYNLFAMIADFIEKKEKCLSKKELVYENITINPAKITISRKKNMHVDINQEKKYIKKILLKKNLFNKKLLSDNIVYFFSLYWREKNLIRKERELAEIPFKNFINLQSFRMSFKERYNFLRLKIIGKLYGIKKLGIWNYIKTRF